MKRIIKKIIPEIFHPVVIKFIRGPFLKYYRKSYSQCGEDIILDLILNKPKGLYIDIGANNPYVQSNTMYFYKKGWNGVNIDATPGSMDKFKRIRKRDLNLEVAISSLEREMIFYIFEHSFYNTFDKRSALANKNKLISQKLIKTVTLENILSLYNVDKDIDFMSIDVEGNDYDILKSNNWEKYRPRIIVIEYISYKKNTLANNIKIKDFLSSVNYRFFCNSFTNAFFIENNFFREKFGNE